MSLPVIESNSYVEFLLFILNPYGMILDAIWYNQASVFSRVLYLLGTSNQKNNSCVVKYINSS